MNQTFSYSFASDNKDKPSILIGSGPFNSMNEAITSILEEFQQALGCLPPLGLEFGVIENRTFKKYIYKSGEFASTNVGIGIVTSGQSVNLSSEIPDGINGNVGDNETALSTAGAYALAQTIARGNEGIVDVKVGGTSVVSSNTKTASIPIATSNDLGVIQIGYSGSGKNYPVQLSNNKAYVNVPWENTTYSAATASAPGLMSSTDKAKLNGIADSAEVNQNAFSTVAIDATHSVAASSKTDTLTLAAGTNITLNVDGKTITINSTGGSGIPADFIEVLEPGIYNVDANFAVEPIAVATSTSSGGSSGGGSSDLEEKVNRIIAILGHLYNDVDGDGTFIISE